MVDENSQGEEPETDAFTDAFEDEAPRSIFSAIWFRVIVVVVVLGVIAAVGAPYVLDWLSSPPVTAPSGTAEGPEPPAATVPSGTVAGTAEPTQAPAPQAPTSAAAVAPAAPTPADKPARGQPETMRAEAPTATAEAPSPAVERKVSGKPKARRVAKAPERPKVKSDTTKVVGGTGAYWVQVGAFRDPTTAKRLADRLRKGRYAVEESMSGSLPVASGDISARSQPTAGAGGDLYDIFISGGSPSDLSAKLGAKGLAAEATAEGAVVKPSLPLREAVALSKDLAAEGLRVQVKRAMSAGPAKSATPPAPVPAVTDGLHRVRVGPYPDRATATAAVHELTAAGFRPYIVKEGG